MLVYGCNFQPEYLAIGKHYKAKKMPYFKKKLIQPCT
jgi:hypothetical protein